MKIKSIKKVHYEKPVPLYDVIDAHPNNNFLIKCNSGYIVSHNCGLLDEVNFNGGANVDYTQSKIMETYRSVKRRMQSRFISSGNLQAKLFIVSSKKSEQDFIESYIETIKDRPEVMVVDEPQWNVKPEGTFSNKRFHVAVGDKKLKSRIINDGEDIEALKLQGYRIIDVPLELKLDFTRDVDQSLMEFAGISCSLVTKFIDYDQLVLTYKKTNVNPFTNPILTIGIKDNLQIQDFYKPELVDPLVSSKPIYIHIDTSLTGDRTGISGVAVMGIREQNYYKNGEFVPVQELVYHHVFTIGIQCPNGSEISLEKNRLFIYYLKGVLGYNIAGISLDGFQSADSKQQFIQAGFDAKIISLDKTPEGYLYFRSSINEQRISMIEIPELEDELINLERNNMTGKIDHPYAGSSPSGSKDMSDSIAGALLNASRMTDKSSLYLESDYESIMSTNDEVEKDINLVIKNSLEQSLRQDTLDTKDSKEEEYKPKLTESSILEEIKQVEYEQRKEIKKAEKERVKNLRNNLSNVENSMVSNDELLDAFFNNDSDMLIW